MTIRTVLLLGLLALAVVFIAAWRRAVFTRRDRSTRNEPTWPTPVQTLIGFVTDFFDTLGIGSLATTTTAFKVLHAVPDECIVGTMIIGHSVPVVVQDRERHFRS